MMPLSRFARRSSWLLVAVLGLQLPVAHAEMLGPEAVQQEQAANQAAPQPSQAELDRAKVKQFLETNDLKNRLAALGVDGLNASRRVDAMTHEEVHALAQRIDSLPAGGALSDRDIILVLLVTLLLVVLL
jgi:hypothetical protein